MNESEKTTDKCALCSFLCSILLVFSRNGKCNFCKIGEFTRTTILLDEKRKDAFMLFAPLDFKYNFRFAETSGSSVCICLSLVCVLFMVFRRFNGMKFSSDTHHLMDAFEICSAVASRFFNKKTKEVDFKRSLFTICKINIV